MSLHVIAPCFAKTDEQAALFVQSAKIKGISVCLYGLGENYVGHTESKLKGALAQIEKMPDSAVVLCSDAFDTLMLADEMSILARYNLVGAPLLLFSAEKNCWPYPNRADEYPQSEMPWRFLNAGGWMGRAEYLKHRIPVVLQQEYDTDDQGMWTQAYLNGSVPGAKIDTDCQIFQTMAGSDEDVKRVPAQKRLLNDVTGTYPCVVHWNGRTEGREEIWRMVK